MYEPTEQDQREFAEYVDDTERQQIAEAEATPPAERTIHQWAALGWLVGPPVGFDA